MSEIVNWERIRAVVFDVDGTLYDGRALRRRMLLELALAVTRQPSRLREILILKAYRTEREKIAESEAEGILSLQYERPASRFGIPANEVQHLVDPWILDRPLPFLRRNRITGAGRLFDRLRLAGRRIAVLSDYPAKAKLDALDLVTDHIVCGTDPDVNRLKPHPAGLEKILAELRLAPAECLLIGDRDDRDGEAARRVDMAYLLRTDRPKSSRQFRDFLTVLQSLEPVTPLPSRQP